MPLHLLPSSLEEHVIVLDYEPAQLEPARAQSISGSLAVTSVKVTDAPGAGAAEEDESHSTKMFVLETTQFYQDKAETERAEPETILVRFKQRNSVLREVLEYQCHSRQAAAPDQAQPATISQATSPQTS
ncbi:hypothetical protein EWM64_g10769 [Hericium alpestre]|uniref:Uncharacterized protein n=1 Tax=Hericium alpestre TaxID=135208 RepID=A0A4Y9ZHE9_9AGAM|nr:hypothetical protein EWM64_g10769 [Hericium alpestre]